MEARELRFRLLYDPETLRVVRAIPDCDGKNSGSCSRCGVRELCDAARLLLSAIVVQRKWFEVEEADA